MNNHWLSTLPARDLEPRWARIRPQADPLDQNYHQDPEAQCRDCGEISSEWGCRCSYIQEMRGEQS
jgi:hypothetical protein